MPISGLRPMPGARLFHMPVPQLPGLCSESILCFESASQLPWAPFTSFPILPDEFKCPIKEEIALTSGEWEVLARHGSKVPESPHTPVYIHVHRHTHTVLTPSDPETCGFSSTPTPPTWPPALALQLRAMGAALPTSRRSWVRKQGCLRFLCWILVVGAWPILPATRSVHLASFGCMKIPVDNGGAHRGTTLHSSLGARSAEFLILWRDPLIRRPGALPPSQLL